MLGAVPLHRMLVFVAESGHQDGLNPIEACDQMRGTSPCAPPCPLWLNESRCQIPKSASSSPNPASPATTAGLTEFAAPCGPQAWTAALKVSFSTLPCQFPTSLLSAGNLNAPSVLPRGTGRLFQPSVRFEDNASSGPITAIKVLSHI